MKKLALKLDDLRVDTFATDTQAAGQGTVQGHYGTNHTQAGHTCAFSCNGTCGEYTCAGSTCDYTCEGYATSPGAQYECVICG